MMVVMGIIGFLSILGYSGVRYLRSSELRDDTTQIAALMKAAQDFATRTGAHHRVVFDLDKQIVRLERCEGDFKLRRGESLEDQMAAQAEAADKVQEDGQIDLARFAADRNLPPEILEAASPEEAAKLAEALTGERIGSTHCLPPDELTGDSKGRGAERKIRAWNGIEVRRMWVQHLEEPVADGLVAVNFFPLGHAEKAIIEIGDESGRYFTLLVHGLSGRVEFREGQLDDPDDHLMRNALGDRVEKR